ncbi:hypothetical protein LTSEINV_0317 [Salmonella enterica subsp. enterica serovar Inverness str. R8-3668]|uniref:Uncharacterized protein n=1 Tax=Salmonella enterica subsp. enterica serovar Inverness str. R8-3668 TaxID=913075 RepID=G5N7Q4_SALET|nr:hypothetical protein LTSEINV_0317 [Salmonella enterica subsp. enterica serovar Inverness str. R8-3668]
MPRMNTFAVILHALRVNAALLVTGIERFVFKSYGYKYETYC